eukprot:7239427-Alexandrium_andersonii.AAC.1
MSCPQHPSQCVLAKMVASTVWHDVDCVSHRPRRDAPTAEARTRNGRGESAIRHNVHPSHSA